MTDKEIISKAKKVLNELKIYYDKDCIPSITRYSDIPAMLLPMFDEEDKNHFSVSFELTLPSGMLSGIFVFFDSTSNKILKIMTKYNIYKVPEGFE